MSLLRPDARGRRLLDGEPVGQDDLECAFVAVLQGEPTAPEAVRTAYEIYESPAHHVLDALLLVRTEPKRICSDLDLAEETLLAYCHLFFDVKVFSNVFARRAYVRQLVDDKSDEFKSYDLVLHEGGEALLTRYRLGDPSSVNEEQLATRALVELSSRMTEHRGRTLTGPTAKASLALAQAVLQGTSSLRNLRPPKSQAVETAFELALVAQVHSRPVSEAPVPPEELIRSADKPK